MKNKEEKRKILNLLKEKGEWISTTEITKLTGIHYYKVEFILDGLLNESLVKKDEKRHSTFWKIKEVVENG